VVALLIGAALADECRYTASDNSVYDLSHLRKTHGKAYSYTDKEGDEWLFNVCGDLSGLQVEDCPKDAVVCKRSKLVPTVNAGKRASWSDFVNKSRGVEVVYGEGDMCEGGIPRKTTFDFVCAKACKSKPQASKLMVTDLKNIDKCYTVITVASPKACPVDLQHEDDDDEDGHRPSGFVFMLLFFTLSVCCLCVCACCARRRRLCHLQKKKQEQEMIQYANTAFHQQQPMPFKQESYTVQMPTTQQAMQFMPQYFVYPSVQVPHQQSPASLEREALLSGDEQLAQELQAQYDRERNAL